MVNWESRALFLLRSTYQILAAFSHRHIPKKKRKQRVAFELRVYGYSGCKIHGGFLSACQWLKFWKCHLGGKVLLMREFWFHDIAVVERCTYWLFRAHMKLGSHWSSWSQG